MGYLPLEHVTYLLLSERGFEKASSLSSSVLPLLSAPADCSCFFSSLPLLAATMMPATMACNVLTSGPASSPHGTPKRSN